MLSRAREGGRVADYCLRSLLCGLRLPMRPLSLPAAGSITALIRGGLPESHGLVRGALQVVGRRHIDAEAAEGFHHPVVARALDEHGGCCVRTACRIDVGP